MAKVPTLIEQNFVVKDEDGDEVIYSPPLLAETSNLRIELRQEKLHARPHVHIIKKSSRGAIEVSLALNNLELLAGAVNLKHFDNDEYEEILKFLIANKLKFIKVYKKLREGL